MSLNLDYDGPLIPTVMATEPSGPLLPGWGFPHGP
jgi:hypothetical protein